MTIRLSFIIITLASLTAAAPPLTTASLIDAIRDGSVGRVEKLLDAGVGVNAPDAEGASPLHHAALSGAVPVMNLLIARGANLNARDRTGMTVLMYAAMAGKVEAVQRIVESNVDLNLMDRNGFSALMWAQRKKRAEVVTILTKAGAFDYLEAERREKELIDASVAGNVVAVKKLLDAGVNINARGTKGSATPLIIAAERNQVDLLKLLLERGADINVRDEKWQSALFHATANDRPDVIGILIQKNADVNARDKTGRTPLMMACHDAREQIMDMLLARGADVKARDMNGNTALMHLISGSGSRPFKLRAAEQLLRKKASPSAQADNGSTPLSLSKKDGFTEMAELLVKAGAKK